MQPHAYPMPPQAPGPRPKGFFERNWGWLVPLGCLGALLAFAVFIIAILGIVNVSMRSSDVYRDAMARASADPAVVRELGPPVEAGFLVSGSLNVSGSSGQADIAIPLVGSVREGTLYAVASKSAGRWTFSTLEVEVEGNPSRLPLLPPAPAPAP
jgi:hypothetical protein